MYFITIRFCFRQALCSISISVFYHSMSATPSTRPQTPAAGFGSTSSSSPIPPEDGTPTRHTVYYFQDELITFQVGCNILLVIYLPQTTCVRSNIISSKSIATFWHESLSFSRRCSNYHVEMRIWRGRLTILRSSCLMLHVRNSRVCSTSCIMGQYDTYISRVLRSMS